MIGPLAALLLLATTPGKPDFVHSLTPADSLIRPGEAHFAHLWQVPSLGAGTYPRWAPKSDGLVFEIALDHPTIWIVGAPSRDIVRGGNQCATSPSFLGPKEVLYAWTADSSTSSVDRWRRQKWTLNPGSKVAIVSGNEHHDLLFPAGSIEPNASPDGKQIVYTATPAIDPELYTANVDGSNVRRLTIDQGYDGGGCFSPDGQLICYQAFHPTLETDKAIYIDLLGKHLVDPSLLDIWVMHADGAGRGQVTDLESTSMEPSFTPDSKRIIFSSDYLDVAGRQFDLYITKLDGGTPEKITNDPGPDCFPMFSPNGRYLAFTSGRGAKTAGAQNVFIAEWKE